MLLVRGFGLIVSGLLLAGCMQTGSMPDANFTARDRAQLANPPYQQAWISPAYQRQIVDYHRKDPPGTILVDTPQRFVYFVLPKGKAVRYGAIVGEDEPEVRPVDLLEIELWRGGERLGVLSRRRELLPGRYAFGLTGRGPQGDRLPRGTYSVRLVARPDDGTRRQVETIDYVVR